ncbi:hypothetical protein ABZ922_15250 [Streptomyces shenzhenensis]|uniref:hypothetical protein n=1 Tax=Streptomyces shenzhenensis TaxID=943815 RepID=UPI0033D93BEE
MRPALEERRVALGCVLGAWLALVEQWHRETHGEDYTALHADVPRWRPSGSKAGFVQAGTIRWAQELRSLIAAVRLASDAGFDELCWGLAFMSASIFEHGGYLDEWQETTQLALAATERAGNRRGKAAMLYSAGRLDMMRQRLRDAERNFTRALELVGTEGDPRDRALLLCNLRALYGGVDEHEHGVAHQALRRVLALGIMAQEPCRPGTGASS